MGEAGVTSVIIDQSLHWCGWQIPTAFAFKFVSSWCKLIKKKYQGLWIYPHTNEYYLKITVGPNLLNTVSEIMISIIWNLKSHILWYSLPYIHIIFLSSLSFRALKHRCVEDYFKIWLGFRLNIKTVLSTYGDFHVKDKTAVRTSYL